MSAPARTVFASRRDRWLTIVLAVAVCVELAGAALALSPRGRSPGAGDVTVALLLVAGAALILWTLLGTRYVVADDTLTIWCGPFRWKIPRSDIRRLTSVTGFVSAPALSVHRVALDVDGRNGVLEISPADPAAFARSVGLPLQSDQEDEEADEDGEQDDSGTGGVDAQGS